MHAAYGQHYSASWRVLTQSQLKNPSDIQTETEMRGFIKENVVDVLRVAGWAETGPKAESALTAFDKKLTSIVNLALRLNRKTGGDWEATIVDPEEPFDPDVMDDGYRDDHETLTSDRVVCTTEIGLCAVEGRGIVVKPTVVLQSMLNQGAFE